MAVPNTTTFTLQDVVNEVNPTTDDLVDCFADAVASKFDSNYNPNSDGTDNNLLNFRNYDSSSLTEFQASGYNLNNGSNQCGQTSSSAFFHNGSSSGPEIGDIVYRGDGVTLDTYIFRKYFPSNSVEVTAVFGTNSSGVVNYRVNCP